MGFIKKLFGLDEKEITINVNLRIEGLEQAVGRAGLTQILAPQTEVKSEIDRTEDTREPEILPKFEGLSRPVVEFGNEE